MSETNIDDGGQAFPTPETEGYHPTLGMTLLDYFAAHAMTALIDGYDHEARCASNMKDRTGLDDTPHDDSDTTYATKLAAESYIVAKAMIAARKNLSLPPSPVTQT